MRSLLAVADQKKRMLFEIAPDAFPEGFVTDVELILWASYYREKYNSG